MRDVPAFTRGGYHIRLKLRRGSKIWKPAEFEKRLTLVML